MLLTIPFILPIVAAAGFDLMAKARPPAFPGLGLMRSPLLALAMSWYALRDRLGV